MAAKPRRTDYSALDALLEEHAPGRGRGQDVELPLEERESLALEGMRRQLETILECSETESRLRILADLRAVLIDALANEGRDVSSAGRGWRPSGGLGRAPCNLVVASAQGYGRSAPDPC
jgi:hypothetical protein